MSFDPVRVFPARLAILQQLLEGYDGKVPFTYYLKSFFRHNRNFGSRDRAFYTKWCFAFFRLGKSMHEYSFREQLLSAGYLTDIDDKSFLDFLDHEKKLPTASNELASRFTQLQEAFPGFNSAAIFPFQKELSGDLANNEYVNSLLSRPLVWIRIKRGKEGQVKKELEHRSISFREDSTLPQALAVEQQTNLEDLDNRKKGFFEIQDRSSQNVAGKIPANNNEHWWDCCCGSGGKTLELLDRVPGVKLTATDSRPSILENFNSRTSKYKNRITASVIDLSQPLPGSFSIQKFDGIVADVPCSGSGTWGRTPESLVYFDEKRLDDYTSLQQTIVKNILSWLKPGGKLVYITCSVFKCENEDIVTWIIANSDLKLIETELIRGAEYGSDSMFYAVFLNLGT